MVAPCPRLEPAALAALLCWHWCGGWNPALWPAYAALHDVEDWTMTIDLMAHIRREVA